MNQKNNILAIAIIVSALLISISLLITRRYKIIPLGRSDVARIDTWTGRTWIGPEGNWGWHEIAGPHDKTESD